MTTLEWAFPTQHMRHLFKLMNDLGLTISDSKLVAPSTKIVCLGVLINTEEGTVSITPEKLHQICDTASMVDQRDMLKMPIAITSRLTSICSQMCEAS